MIIQTYKIGEIFSRFSSGKMISEKYINNEGKYPVFGGNGLRGFTNEYNFSGECIIVGRQGAKCGNVRYFNGFGYMTDHAIVGVCNNHHSTKFLNYALSSLNLNRLSGQAAQPGLSVTMLKKQKIQLPDYETQIKIVNIVDKYDLLIENNNKRIKILEQMAEELYKEWFVRFRFPGFCNEERKDELPKGWQIEKLETVAMISTGKCNREDAVENGEFPLFDRSQEIKKSDMWLKDCEAIIVPGEGTSFIPRYYKGKFNLHQRCYCVEPRYENIGFFLFQTLKLNRIYFLSVATGATVPSLRMKNFTSMKFILPSTDLCAQYNKLASDFYEKIKQLNKINENLIKQRDLLLPRLMSGKLEVK